MSNARQTAVVSSSLWAAAGDVLGWITELGDADTVRHRTGRPFVDKPVNWKRRIGGRFGPTVSLPAGTYSDDTQLRLAVSRATMSNGEFDAEAFGKIELPVWTSYSLGGGRGTTAAATNLSKSSVAWFSNFFGSKGERGYFDAGGNGAAMRIQPHVWKSSAKYNQSFIKDVIRDAIITHGHPKGFCGAVFHAFCISHSLNEGSIAGPNELVEFCHRLELIVPTVKQDDKLSVFWLDPWEQQSGRSLVEAVRQEIAECLECISKIRSLLGERDDRYAAILEACGGYSEKTRGAGSNTAIAAAALSYLCRDRPHHEMIVLGANAIGSDTDTISSMAGAISGAALPMDMYWDLQDREYIVHEANRMYEISMGQKVESFVYPDLLSFEPPASQVDAVGNYKSEIYIKGFGKIQPFGEVWSVSENNWQWIRTGFGQSMLAKRRSNLKSLSNEDLPHEAYARTVKSDQPSSAQSDIFQHSQSSNIKVIKGKTEKSIERNSAAIIPSQSNNLDYLIDRVISSDFDPLLIGKSIASLAVLENGVESSVAFAAVISKAINARRKRER